MIRKPVDRLGDKLVAMSNTVPKMLFASALSALAGCSSQPVAELPPGVTTELGESAACEELVLSDSVALPSSADPTRFLNGWWPDRQSEGALLAPSGRASIALASTGSAATLVLTTDAVVTARLDGQPLEVLATPAEKRLRVPVGPPGIRYVELEAAAPFSVGGARLERLNEATVRVVECALAVVSQRTVEVESSGEAQWSLWVDAADRPALRSGSRRQLLELDGGTHPRLSVRYEEGARLRLTLDAVDPAADSQRPSHADGPPPKLVLVYVLDALRADAVEALAETSTWKRLGREGVRFVSHRSVAPNTLPSTKALHVGKVWTQQGGHQLAAEEITLAERYREAGYTTGLFSNNPWVSSEYGLGQGFDVAATASPDDTSAAYFDDAERVHEAAQDWLNGLPADEPVFLYLHVLHPHNPYAPPAALAAHRCGGIDSSLDGSTKTLLSVQRRRIETTPADEDRLRCLYQSSLEYADVQLASFLEAVASRFDPESSIVFLTSDHGEELFEHDGVLHGYNLFEEMIRIPLVIWAPGRLAPATVEQSTGTIDVHDLLAGVAASGVLFDPTAIPPRPHFAAAASLRGGIVSLQTTTSKVIWSPRRGDAWGQGQGRGRRRDSVELFQDLGGSGERERLRPWSSAEALWLLAQLRNRLVERTALVSEEPQIDESVRRRLESLGYVD